MLIEWAQGGVIDIESMPEHVQKELQVRISGIGGVNWNGGIQTRNATMNSMNQSTDMDMEMDDEKGIYSICNND